MAGSPGSSRGGGVGGDTDAADKGKAAAVEDVYVCLSELQEGASAAVKVMVCWKWDVSNSFGKYLGTKYILSDLEGNTIQCSARSSIAHRFVCKLHEGSVYCLKNFSVLPNKDKFRVRRNDPHTICLEGYTIVRKLTCEVAGFPRFPFDLVPLEEIELNDSAYLIDVIGCVSGIGKIRTTRGGSELVEFELVNERQGQMKVTLWAPLCHDILKRKSSAVDPYIVILRGMNVKEFNGELFISNTSATSIFDAPDIPQIVDFSSNIRKCEIGITPVKLSPATSTVGSVFQLLRAGREQKDTRKRSLTFHCKVKVTTVRTKDGWFYFSCGIGGCKRRVSWSGSKFMCQTCNKICEFPRTSYRLHLTVADSTGTVVVTLFDVVAEKLLGKKAAELLSETEEDDGDDVLPAKILALTDTTHTLEIKSNTYYDQGSYESFTVSNVVDVQAVKITVVDVQAVKTLPLKRPIDDVGHTKESPQHSNGSGAEDGDVSSRTTPLQIHSDGDDASTDARPHKK